MDRDTLLTRKAAIEQQFEQASKTRSDADDEMKRLQGEHRLVLALLEDVPIPVIERAERIRKVMVEDDAQTEAK